MSSTTQSLLAPLPYDVWADTKKTLQLFTQVVGKLQLRYTRLRNHWWNITFRPTSRGIATHLMRIDVMNDFGTSYVGKQSEPQLFWHSFDLAVGRYSGREALGPPPASRVMREAYFREVIAFGFWAGDANIPAPTFYTYTAPEPAALAGFTLRPAAARWVASGNGHLGTLPYDVVREAPDPRTVLLEFFGSGFEAGTSLAAWDTSNLLRPALQT